MGASGVTTALRDLVCHPGLRGLVQGGLCDCVVVFAAAATTADAAAGSRGSQQYTNLLPSYLADLVPKGSVYTDTHHPSSNTTTSNPAHATMNFHPTSKIAPDTGAGIVIVRPDGHVGCAVALEAVESGWSRPGSGAGGKMAAEGVVGYFRGAGYAVDGGGDGKR